MIGNPVTWWLTMVAAFGPAVGTIAFIFLILVAISLLAGVLQYLADHVFL